MTMVLGLPIVSGTKDEKRLERLTLEEFNDGVADKKIEITGLSIEQNPDKSRFSKESHCYIVGHFQIVGTSENPIVHSFAGTTGGIKKIPVLYGRYLKK